MKRIHVIHENAAWSEPLFAALKAKGLPYEDWFLDKGELPLDQAPPEGVFYNRMSASSHTRDHRFAGEFTLATLMWLETHGRRVLNSSRSLMFELSKAAQQAELKRFEIDTPRTIAAVGREAILAAAARFEGPVILKPNRGGTGFGVQLFREREAISAYLDGPTYVAPLDGITLVQDYIETPEPFITRLEFVGQRFMYAVRVDTSEGFELCPADACAIEDAHCPVGEGPAKFQILETFEHPILERFCALMRRNDIHIAACEFAMSRDGGAFVYDVNMNVNYNTEAEARAQASGLAVSGMGEIAKYLGEELSKV